MMNAPKVPAWVQDTVFYQIFPDRFARSREAAQRVRLEPWDSPPTVYGFKGGDLPGIIERLDYLSDLGVNAVYLNPIFQSAANHRYHTYDYGRVDPLLGGTRAFRELLKACHDRRIRVVLDGVFNHSGRGFFQFHDILENGIASPYLDWFHVSDLPLRAYPGRARRRLNYAAWAGLPALPKFNLGNPEVRGYLLGVAEHWTREGIDGWRLDVPTEIEDETFWQEFRSRVRAINPEAYLVGEVWVRAPEWLRGDRFDALMNYPLSRACLGFFGGEDLDTTSRPGGHRLERLKARAFADRVDAIMADTRWPVVLAQLNLLGSHDTPRALTLLGGARRRLKLALLFLLTCPGAPCLYYGDEVGLGGGPDPDCRAAMPWDPSRWDLDLRDHVRRWVAVRHKLPALRRGDFARLYAHRGVFAFRRRYEGETIVVVLNANTEPAQVRLQVSGHLADGTRLNRIGGENRVVVRGGRLPPLCLEPLDGEVWHAPSGA